jgi:hypothetical protein
MSRQPQGAIRAGDVRAAGLQASHETREHDERSNQIRIARRRGEEEGGDMFFVAE